MLPDKFSRHRAMIEVGAEQNSELPKQSLLGVVYDRGNFFGIVEFEQPINDNHGHTAGERRVALTRIKPEDDSNEIVGIADDAHTFTLSEARHDGVNPVNLDRFILALTEDSATITKLIDNNAPAFSHLDTMVWVYDDEFRQARQSVPQPDPLENTQLWNVTENALQDFESTVAPQTETIQDNQAETTRPNAVRRLLGKISLSSFTPTSLAEASFQKSVSKAYKRADKKAIEHYHNRSIHYRTTGEHDKSDYHIAAMEHAVRGKVKARTGYKVAKLLGGDSVPPIEERVYGVPPAHIKRKTIKGVPVRGTNPMPIDIDKLLQTSDVLQAAEQSYIKTRELALWSPALQEAKRSGDRQAYKSELMKLIAERDTARGTTTRVAAPRGDEPIVILEHREPYTSEIVSDFVEQRANYNRSTSVPVTEAHVPLQKQSGGVVHLPPKPKEKKDDDRRKTRPRRNQQ